jgi:hypothetical protein
MLMHSIYLLEVYILELLFTIIKISAVIYGVAIISVVVFYVIPRIKIILSYPLQLAKTCNILIKAKAKGRLK